MKGINLFDPIYFEIENDIYENSEGLLHDIVLNMVRVIPNKIDRLIFVCHFLNHTEQQVIAEVLHIHPTNVSRRVKRIRRVLKPFALGYTFVLSDVKYRHKSKDN